MRVSVVIPCYNREERIADAIRSALGQTLKPSEVVVVDDGSTDRTAEVASHVDPCVRVIRTVNNGPAIARNIGISEARGDWIAFLDSDDVWNPQKLERQADASARFPDAGLIFCDTETVAQEQVVSSSRFGLGGLYGAEIESKDDTLRFDRGLFRRMIAQSRVITSAVMVKRTLTRLRFSEKLRYSQDWALWLDLVLQNEFVAVDKVLVTMHFDGDNQTAKMDRILRHDVVILDDLLRDERLTEEERTTVAAELAKRRIGAIYHSLLAGEGREARKLLRCVAPEHLKLSRRIAYRIASVLPRGVIQAVGSFRG